MSPRKFVDLYEIVVSVDEKGVHKRLSKYRTTFTGKNYLATMFTPEDRANGYNLGWGSSRINSEQIFKVQRMGLFGDSFNNVRRRIYFLEGQQEEALTMLRDDLNKTIKSITEQVNALALAWENRNSQ